MSKVESILADEYGLARLNMIRNQLIPNQITNLVLLEAMSSMPRHLFVDEKYSSVAYSDGSFSIDSKRRLLEPLLFAKMVEACKIDKTSKILDIGCGFGYSSIILAKMAELVVGIDNDITTITQAKYLAGNLNVTNCFFKVKELFDYCAEEFLFDIIFINGALHEVPSVLFDQLTHKGRMVLLEPSAGILKLVLYFKSPKGISREELFAATADFV